MSAFVFDGWLSVGKRVQTPKGQGVVMYLRMGPPSYLRPAAASVVLDDEHGRPSYSGTVFNVSELSPVAP